MEWLSSFAGGGGIPLLVAVVIIVVIALFAIKKGWVAYNGKGISIGTVKETELRIVRNQMQYMKAVLDGTIADIPVRLREGLHYYRTKFVISEIKDIFEEIIIYNHVQDDDMYISIKQDIIYGKILDLTEDDFFKTPEFKKYLYDLIENIIRKFVKIRQQEEERK